jgi:MYXO-CTERM domain-containing protein
MAHPHLGTFGTRPRDGYACGWSRCAARRAGALIGGAVFGLPGAVLAEDIALEAPADAFIAQPGDTFDVIADLLEDRGHTVSVVSGVDIDTLEEIQAFDTVVIAGTIAEYPDVELFDGVLAQYVGEGGGLVISGVVYADLLENLAPGLMTVAPFDRMFGYLPPGEIHMIGGHVIVDGLSDWDNPVQDAVPGPLKEGAIALSSIGGEVDSAAWGYGDGRVVMLAPFFAMENYQVGTWALLDGSLPDATEMFLRAVEWSGVAGILCNNDGAIDPGEVCDDGNLSNADACLNLCVPASCGDGFTQSGVEPCDDGNGINDDDCLVGCVAPTCGDGFVSKTEGCEDGKDDNTDACVSATCEVASCGDGYVFVGFEECDDGNELAGDGCTACQIDASESSSGTGSDGSPAEDDGGTSSTGGDESSTGSSTGSSSDPGSAGESSGPVADASGPAGDSTSAEVLDSSGTDAGSAAMGESVTGADGCSCRSATSSGGSGMWLAALGAFGARRRRRPARSGKS